MYFRTSSHSLTKYYIGIVPYGSNYLAHSGTKGMQWHVRRYQNYDGSYTPLGREHYGIGPPRVTKDKAPIKKSGLMKIKQYIVGKSKNKNVKEKESLVAQKQKNSNAKKERLEAVKNRRSLSTKDIEDRISRIKLEKQLKELTNEDVRPGRAKIGKILSQSTEIVATTAVKGLMAFIMNQVIERSNPAVADMLEVKNKIVGDLAKEMGKSFGEVDTLQNRKQVVEAISKATGMKQDEIDRLLKAANVDFSKAAAYIAPNPNQNKK